VLATRQARRWEAPTCNRGTSTARCHRCGPEHEAPGPGSQRV